MKPYCFIIFCILGVLQIRSQSLSSILSVAEESLTSENYFDAYKKYQEALEFEPTNIAFLYKAAEAARMLQAYRQSAEYYDAVLKHENNNLYPKTSFYLGLMRQKQGDYVSAITNYKIYQTEHGGEDSSLLAIAKKEIQACQWAIEQIKNPTKGVEINRMNDQINSPYSDFAPILIKDEKLIYSSLRFENKMSQLIPKRFVSSILTSTKEETPILLANDSFIPSGLNLAHTSFNSKFTKVYYTICEDLNDHDKRCDIYVSNVDSTNHWSVGTKLPDPVNKSSFTNTQPNWAYLQEQNSEVLYFVSDRPGGKGELDIWYTYIDSLGNYSEPINCSDLNTIQNDISPFFHEKTKTMYYSSEGQLGMGGYDVYSSKLTFDHWSIPKNLGVPVNSSFDDVYFAISYKDTIAYFASNRTGTQFLDNEAEACCLDLFKVKMQSCEVKLEALVYNLYTKAEILGATVSLYDLDQANSTPVAITNLNSNNFSYTVLCDKNYKLIATKPGYTSDSVSLYTGLPGEFPTISKKLFLKPTIAKLDVLTFNRNTGDPLFGVTVILKDLDDLSRPPDTLRSDSSNITHFSLIPCHKYELTGSKEEFATTGFNFKVDCGLDGTMTQKLYLPTILFSFLPVTLYFDNDRPGPNSMSLSTKLAYSNTFKSYIKQEDLFLRTYAKITVNESDSVKNAMNDFFENEIKYGQDKFNKFLVVLEKDLIRGKKYEIFVKGYASPLAKSDYNYNLSQRRITSIYNEFYKYHNGILNKYIKNKQLKLSQKPFGETTAPPGISDKKQDPRSVFTIEASRERRVEIIEIKE